DGYDGLTWEPRWGVVHLGRIGIVEEPFGYRRFAVIGVFDRLVDSLLSFVVDLIGTLLRQHSAFVHFVSILRYRLIGPDLFLVLSRSVLRGVDDGMALQPVGHRLQHIRSALLPSRTQRFQRRVADDDRIAAVDALAGQTVGLGLPVQLGLGRGVLDVGAH